MAVRYYRNGPRTTLSGPISTSSATSATVLDASVFPTQFPYTLILDPDTSTEEVVDVTGATGNTLTIVRGVDSTTAVAHANGAVVFHGISARDMREANSHVNQTTDVHGGTGVPLDAGSVQTVAGQKTFNGGLLTPGGQVVDVGSAQTVTGAKTSSGNNTYSGSNTFSGPNAFSGANTHSGSETFTGPFLLSGFDFTATGGTQYTPTWGASTNPSLGNGTIDGRYFKIGKLVIAWITLVIGSTTNTGSGQWNLGLPPSQPRDANIIHVGIAHIVQAGVVHRTGAVVANGAAIVNVFPDNSASPAASTVPHTWSSSDALRILFAYVTTA